LAAKNAMGIDSNYQGTLPLHILKVADIDLTSLGQTYAQKENIEEIIHMNTKKGQYVKLIHDKNNLLGCIVLGITGISFRLEKLIRKKLPIKELLPYLEQGDWDILKRKKIK
jgi:NAD(P)H-nitrite reductase large subunit